MASQSSDLSPNGFDFSDIDFEANSSSQALETSPSLTPRYSSPPVPDATPIEIAAKRTSSIWDHCYFPRTTIVRDNRKRSIWRCAYCTQVYMESGGTKNARAHLRSKHSRQIKTTHDVRIGGYQERINMSEFRVNTQNIEYKRRRLDNTTDTNSINPAVLEDLYVAWITSCGIPFEMVTREEFRA